MSAYTNFLITTTGLNADLSVFMVGTVGSANQGHMITNVGDAGSLTGSAAADWVTGGSGNDTITGGAGVDAFAFTIGADGDVFYVTSDPP